MFNPRPNVKCLWDANDGTVHVSKVKDPEKLSATWYNISKRKPFN